MSTTPKWLAGINAVLGLWLIAAPFVFSVPQTSMGNAVIVGALLAVGGGYNWYRTIQDEEVNVGGAGLNTLLGLWMIAALELKHFPNGAHVLQPILGLTEAMLLFAPKTVNHDVFPAGEPTWRARPRASPTLV